MNIRSVLAAAVIVAVSAAAGAAPNPPISGCTSNRLPCGNGAVVCAVLASQRNDMPDSQSASYWVSPWINGRKAVLERAGSALQRRRPKRSPFQGDWQVSLSIRNRAAPSPSLHRAHKLQEFGARAADEFQARRSIITKNDENASCLVVFKQRGESRRPRGPLPHFQHRRCRILAKDKRFLRPICALEPDTRAQPAGTAQHRRMQKAQCRSASLDTCSELLPQAASIARTMPIAMARAPNIDCSTSIEKPAAETSGSQARLPLPIATGPRALTGRALASAE